jgi:hypothetical protein
MGHICMFRLAHLHPSAALGRPGGTPQTLEFTDLCCYGIFSPAGKKKETDGGKKCERIEGSWMSRWPKGFWKRTNRWRRML